MKWLLVAVVLLTPGMAHALDYTDQTRCSAMTPLVDITNPPPDDVTDASIYIGNVFDELDEAHVENGEPGIVARWSDHGLGTNKALVVIWCRQHPKETVFNAAAETYNGLRDIEIQFGAAQ